MSNFKKGDWCFCEFKLQQIMEMNGQKVTEVSDGMFRHSSSDLSDRCFPIDMTIKILSDNASYWMDRFHSLEVNGLNYPDLSRAIIGRWVELCLNKDDKEKIKELSTELSSFGNCVIEAVKNSSSTIIDGVSLFRH